MRHTYGPSLAPIGGRIAYIVRDGGYPYAVLADLTEDGVGPERPIRLPMEGPVTKVLHSPDGKWIACEVSPKGSERLETFIVPTDPEQQDAAEAKSLRNTFDAKTTLVEWDHHLLAMDAVASDGVTEARLVHPETSRYKVVDRRSDSLLVAAEAEYSLMRVGPRGNRELLLTTPNGDWIPLLPPEPGAATEEGRIFLLDPETLVVFLATDHGAQRRRIVRLTIDLPSSPPRRSGVEELIASPDADVDEFVISEDMSTAAVLWNQDGVSILEVLILGADQRVMVRRTVDVPGMVAFGLSITDDGSLLSVTVEGPNLPPSVEILRVDGARVESCNPQRAQRLEERTAAVEAPELVHYTARDGLELSGWLYVAPDPSPRGTVYIHLHGGPEGQSRPVNHDCLTALVDSGVTVFTPNIRGSKGNGRAFLHADDRYGRFSAIDDVADTVQFLIDAHLAQRDAILLGGRSYGGYLSTLAAARYPDLVVGVVDACGMSSFETYYESTEPWLASAASPKYGYPMHDAELLMEISPLYKADQVLAPVLLIHGGNDGAVPIGESQQLRDALVEARGGDDGVEFLVLPEEGHQFVVPASRELIATRMLEFFRGLGLVDRVDLSRFASGD
ncbi:alpha/beta hydrolase family protein [Corynebacterium heidelbergense]|uniref:S9 family peptidase n=1 Tax=Corynebacterium heidelbergense TaxID=2055947 RepID=A0A364V9J2_9CORY|nr:alpha/beta fold hydrolase [Corynebacterium heidelbergense]RAV33236.1 S9 family peptidase [Corynebacterium heidelbergense]WCZ37261.1 Prolyl tripeptidyl peptidase precursor [Corynebacterium heidelbergense]